MQVILATKKMRSSVTDDTDGALVVMHCGGFFASRFTTVLALK